MSCGMKYLPAVIALCLAMGCTGPDVQKQWNEALKDANGDNMKMRNDFSTPSAMPSRTTSSKPSTDD
jgi:hypothetical protein